MSLFILTALTPFVLKRIRRYRRTFHSLISVEPVWGSKYIRTLCWNVRQNEADGQDKDRHRMAHQTSWNHRDLHSDRHSLDHDAFSRNPETGDRSDVNRADFDAECDCQHNEEDWLCHTPWGQK